MKTVPGKGDIYLIVLDKRKHEQHKHEPRPGIYLHLVAESCDLTDWQKKEGRDMHPCKMPLGYYFLEEIVGEDLNAKSQVVGLFIPSFTDKAHVLAELQRDYGDQSQLLDVPLTDHCMLETLNLN